MRAIWHPGHGIAIAIFNKAVRLYWLNEPI